MSKHQATLGVLLAIGLAAAGCGDGDDAQPTVTTAISSTAPTTASTEAPSPEDPYEVYLANAPADAPYLSREDAQVRAMLGCGTTWAPGTVDGVLQEAYMDFVEQWRDEGLCESP